MGQLLISLNGIDKRVLKKNINGVLISENDKLKDVEKYKLLQANFSSIEDLIKAKHIINDQIKIIKEIVIMNRDIDLNMISYQYDYEYIKKCYVTLTNIIYFINILIANFNKEIKFILSFDNENHYKIHFNNFKLSIINYLEALKKDLEKSHQINIKILD
tara:strand:- start:700 stop:1179 length:480 start_codon:yes stop_codon:yes gene_type:complete